MYHIAYILRKVNLPSNKGVNNCFNIRIYTLRPSLHVNRIPSGEYLMGQSEKLLLGAGSNKFSQEEQLQRETVR
jgi:hypothetical protein